MRRQRRKARQIMPKVKKSRKEKVSYSEPDFEVEKKVQEIIDHEDPKRAELLNVLNDAVVRWKEQKNLPQEKRESTFSKVFKKFSKKKEKDKKAYEDAKKFLKKISNFNPEQVEKINLDKIKPEKARIEKKKKHPRSIKGEKLQIDLKENLNLTKKEKIKEEKISLAHKEINEAIEKHKKYTKKITTKKTLHIIEEPIPEIKIKKVPERNKQKISKPKIPHIKIDKFKNFVNKAKNKLNKQQIEKIRKTLGEKSGTITTEFKKIFASLRKQVLSLPKKIYEDYPKEYVKEKDGFKERSIFLKEKKHKKKFGEKKKEQIDEDIDKIYKEIIQI